MTPEQLAGRIETILWCFAIPVLLYAIFRVVRREYQLHQNSNTPICTDRATVYFKHDEIDLPYVGRGYDYVRYITFHTDHGEAVKLYMTGQDFFEINENDVGILTWQGTKFWKFEPEKKEA
jgi:hypothetical protein